MSILTWINERVERWKKTLCSDCGKKLICKKCGSANVKPQGWADRNHRHTCDDCGNVDWL